jgi:hypothetical protein
MAELRIPWWQWWPLWSWRCVAIVGAADEVPERLPRRATVIVGSLNRVKWLAFDCPCAAKHRVLLNCDPERRPVWTIMFSYYGRLSIAPSVDQVQGGRRCHYFVRNGKTVWAKD